MSKIELTMQAIGVEQSSCCNRQFERGETMNAVVSRDGEPLGWWCSDCIEKHNKDKLTGGNKLQSERPNKGVIKKRQHRTLD